MKKQSFFQMEAVNFSSNKYNNFWSKHKVLSQVAKKQTSSISMLHTHTRDRENTSEYQIHLKWNSIKKEKLSPTSLLNIIY